MSDFTVFLSPKKPTTIDISSGFNYGADSGINIFLVPEAHGNTQHAEVSIGILAPGMFSEDDSMFEAFFDPGSSYINWERLKADYNPEVLLSGITVHYKHPVGEIEAYPYWLQTLIAAQTPGKIATHSNFITHSPMPPEEKGEIDPSNNWTYSLTENNSYDKLNPGVLPGEYIVCRHALYIDGKSFSRDLHAKFETPLFTGGWIREITGEGANTRYTVEVFGAQLLGIRPTDFYSKYSVDKWVYLIKHSASLEPGKKDYESSNIVQLNGGSCQIAPYNFGGSLLADSAVDSDDAINMDMSLDFEEIFDMDQLEGQIVSIDYESNTADVDIPGASVHSLPIFYYCEGEDTINRGARAFYVGDSVMVCKKENTWAGAKIIGFPNGLRPCMKYMAIEVPIKIRTLYDELKCDNIGPYAGDNCRTAWPECPDGETCGYMPYDLEPTYDEDPYWTGYHEGLTGPMNKWAVQYKTVLSNDYKYYFYNTDSDSDYLRGMSPHEFNIRERAEYIYDAPVNLIGAQGVVELWTSDTLGTEEFEYEHLVSNWWYEGDDPPEGYWDPWPVLDTVNITRYALAYNPSLGALTMPTNKKITSTSIGDSSATIKWTDGGASDVKMFTERTDESVAAIGGEGCGDHDSVLKFSTDSVGSDFYHEAPMSISMFPSALEYNGMTFYRKRFLNVELDTGWGTTVRDINVFVEYEAS